MHRGKPADLKVLAAVGALGGIAAIAAERQRHSTIPHTEGIPDEGVSAAPGYDGHKETVLNVIGYSAQHDDDHANGELAAAGAAYAVPAPRRWLADSWGQQMKNLRNALWPFGEFPE